MFMDIARIYVKAGRGGDGVVAWRREAHEPAGGPYGGDGGRGGDIIIETDEGIRTLMDFRYKRSYKGENGENGGTKRKFGKAGEDIILKVPLGTLIKDEDTGGVIADLKEPGESFVIAKGGRGGRGNARFTTATRQAPNFAEPGTRGTERNIVLELKTLADAGLIGFPNVGKSTMLSTLSAANPKIANYHFTTLQPNLGVVRVDVGKSYVLADIPGLIEGAHEGVGLGHDFLRHIERTRVLIHVIDVSGFENRDPIEDFYAINKELSQYDRRLEEKPQIIVANKMDIPGAEENLERLKEEFIPKGYKIIEVSAATRQGIDNLKFEIWNLIKETEENYETFDDVHIEDEVREDGIIVLKENDEYIVKGGYIEKLLEATHFNSSDSMRHFQKILRDQGVIEKLKELGITEDDTVFIMDMEFDFFE